MGNRYWLVIAIGAIIVAGGVAAWWLIPNPFRETNDESNDYTGEIQTGRIDLANATVFVITAAPDVDTPLDEVVVRLTLVSGFTSLLELTTPFNWDDNFRFADVNSDEILSIDDELSIDQNISNGSGTESSLGAVIDWIHDPTDTIFQTDQV